MATHEEISGIFRRVKWRSKDGTDYIIGFLKDNTTVKGNAEEGELCEGTAYRFFGRWVEGSFRGVSQLSFHFVCFVKDLPHSREGVIKYLERELKGKRTGIGEVTANRLYDLYGADTVRKLRMETAKVASEAGIDLDKARLAAKVLEEDRKFEDAKIQLAEIFAGKGFSHKAISECIERWGAKAPAMIRRDAFQLMTNRISGAGFSRCDNLYLALGGDPAKLKRQALCAWNGLRENGAGHTWHKVEVGIQAIKDKVSGVNIQPIKALRLARRSGLIAVHRENGNTWLADGNKAKAETDVARIVAQFLTMPANWPIAKEARMTEEQKQELGLATSGRISILLGSAGTGKTWVAARLIRTILSERKGEPIAILAPTGKAACRITEVMAENKIDLRGQTIHRALQPNNPERGHAEGEWGFSYNEANKLPHRFIVVDETSMIDTSTFASLLRAVRSDAHILLIGDPYQLPPVSHGAPLRDLIEAGVPFGKLTEIHRNRGLIVKACQSIKDQKPFEICQRFDGDFHNLRLVNVGSPAGVIEHLSLLIESMKQNRNWDIFEEFQILVPLNEKSEIGRKQLNPYLQNLINPDGERAEKNRYRVRDKVICLRNKNYPSSDDPKLKHSVFNGEQGRVLEVSPVSSVFEFPDSGDGDRIIRVPTTGEFAGYFDLGYAITGHKSQGSQWPVVVTIIDEAANRICSREWHYTCLSRAQKRQLIIGRMPTIIRQCVREELSGRKTFLKEKIAEELLTQSVARESLENHIREDASHVRAESIQAATT